MEAVILQSFSDELAKISMPKIKSNDRMPPATKSNVAQLRQSIEGWESPHRDQSLQLADSMTDKGLFELLHSMRRWYSGQTMARTLKKHQDTLGTIMKLKPDDAVGVFRGFKVPNDHHLAALQPGQIVTIPVTRNRGLSSWTTQQESANKFSGGGKGKTGLIVKLLSGEGIKPLLAPPSHTEPWFNELYSHAIGRSFRPTETEYLIDAPEVRVEIVRVKKR